MTKGFSIGFLKWWLHAYILRTPIESKNTFCLCIWILSILFLINFTTHLFNIVLTSWFCMQKFIQILLFKLKIFNYFTYCLGIVSADNAEIELYMYLIFVIINQIYNILYSFIKCLSRLFWNYFLLLNSKSISICFCKLIFCDLSLYNNYATKRCIDYRKRLICFFMALYQLYDEWITLPEITIAFSNC